MVKTSILQKICPICNKEYNYKVIEDDGINWLGLRTSDGKTEVIDKGCPHCKNAKNNVLIIFKDFIKITTFFYFFL